MCIFLLKLLCVLWVLVGVVDVGVVVVGSGLVLFLWVRCVVWCCWLWVVLILVLLLCVGVGVDDLVSKGFSVVVVGFLV